MTLLPVYKSQDLTSIATENVVMAFYRFAPVSWGTQRRAAAVTVQGLYKKLAAVLAKYLCFYWLPAAAGLANKCWHVYRVSGLHLFDFERYCMVERISYSWRFMTKVVGLLSLLHPNQSNCLRSRSVAYTNPPLIFSSPSNYQETTLWRHIAESHKLAVHVANEW